MNTTKQIGLWLDTAANVWIVSLDEVYSDGSNASSHTLYTRYRRAEAEPLASAEAEKRGLPVVWS